MIVADPNSESFPTIQCEKCEKKYCFDCMKDAHAPSLLFILIFAIYKMNNNINEFVDRNVPRV